MDCINEMGFTLLPIAPSDFHFVELIQVIPNTNMVHGWAGALVQWLWEETHVPKFVGWNPGAVNLDNFFHIYLL